MHNSMVNSIKVKCRHSCTMMRPSNSSSDTGCDDGYSNAETLTAHIAKAKNAIITQFIKADIINGRKSTKQIKKKKKKRNKYRTGNEKSVCSNVRGNDAI